MSTILQPVEGGGAISDGPAPDYPASISFLKDVQPLGPWCLCAINHKTHDFLGKSFSPEQEAACHKWIESQNGQQSSIYYRAAAIRPGVSAATAKDDDVIGTRTAWVDIDPRAGEDRTADRARILALLTTNRPPDAPEPSRIIDSGNGYQALFIFSTPQKIDEDGMSVDDFRAINLALELRFGADSCHAPNHLLRLPGTINWKRQIDGRYPVASIVKSDGPAHDPAKLERKYPSNNQTAGKSLPNDGDESTWVKYANAESIPVSPQMQKIILTLIDPLDPSRFSIGSHSEAQWTVTLAMASAGMTYGQIAGVLTDPKFKVHEAILRTHGGTRNRPDWKGYLDKQIRKAMEKAKSDSKPPLPDGAIVIEGGKINDLVETAEKLLIDGGEPIYQRGAILSRPVRLDTREAEKMNGTDGVNRKAGALVLSPVSQLWIVRALARQGKWYRRCAKDDVAIDPPVTLAAHILDKVGDWKFPCLRSVITTPTLRADGTILQVPGYDPASQLIYDPAVSFPIVPEHPTIEDARLALTTFDPIFAGFPFATGPDKSVLYAAILTALIRPSLRTAPLFAFSAPAAGTGKSKLCECIGVIALGSTPSLINVGAKDDEFKKQLDSVLRHGDPVVWLDNVSRPLHGDTLCSMLTNPMVKIRILGLTEDVDCPATCIVLATGNNIAFQGDLCRRVLVCTLDANMERPDTRRFDFDPVGESLRHRVDLVMAGLTILRAFIVAQRPTLMRLEPFGSFEDFDLIRGAIIWLGMDDPCKTRLDIFKSDESRESLVEAMAAWHELIGDTAVTLTEIRDRWTNAIDRYKPLVDALKDSTGQSDDRDFNAKVTGNRLRRFKSTIIGGFKLEQAGFNRNKVAQWKVTKVVTQLELPDAA